MKKVILLALLCLMSDQALGSVSSINFLIPGGEGGGWDLTARQTGTALIKAGLIERASYQNYQGAGGGRALYDLIRNGKSYPQTLMVQSSPLILRNLTGVFNNSYHQITPISIMIADYQVIAVTSDSPLQSMSELLARVQENVMTSKIIGGSPPGRLDHITLAMVWKAAGMNPKMMRYIASNGGGNALARLYNHDGIALVTGYSEIAEDLLSGKLRVLGIASHKRIKGSNVPTFKEQGLDVVFANWRGFFARPGISKRQTQDYVQLLKTLTSTDAWRQVRDKYGWTDFYKSGEEMTAFLRQQEMDLKAVLRALE